MQEIGKKVRTRRRRVPTFFRTPGQFSAGKDACSHSPSNLTIKAYHKIFIIFVLGTSKFGTYTVNTGSGLGTVRLDVPASATIDNEGGSPMSVTPFTTGESYTIVDVIYEISLPLVIR